MSYCKPNKLQRTENFKRGEEGGGGAQVGQKSRSHHKITGVERSSYSKVDTEGPNNIVAGTRDLGMPVF